MFHGKDPHHLRPRRLLQRVIAGAGRATEKLEGTNIRVILRAGRVVRVEKRRNPSKLQKQQGIIDGWYVDAEESANDVPRTYAALQQFLAKLDSQCAPGHLAKASGLITRTGGARRSNAKTLLPAKPRTSELQRYLCRSRGPRTRRGARAMGPSFG